MKRCTKYLLSIILCLICNFLYAQNAEMADTMRSEGKIYVVVAIILIILAGFFAYLFSLDRKISRIEKALKKNFPN